MKTKNVVIMVHVTPDKPGGKTPKVSIEGLVNLFGRQVTKIVNYTETENGCIAELVINLDNDKISLS